VSSIYTKFEEIIGSVRAKGLEEELAVGSPMNLKQVSRAHV